MTVALSNLPCNLLENRSENCGVQLECKRCILLFLPFLSCHLFKRR